MHEDKISYEEYENLKKGICYDCKNKVCLKMISDSLIPMEKYIKNLCRASENNERIFERLIEQQIIFVILIKRCSYVGLSEEYRKNISIYLDDKNVLLKWAR